MGGYLIAVLPELLAAIGACPLHSRTIARSGFTAFNDLAHVFDPPTPTQRALMRVTAPATPRPGSFHCGKLSCTISLLERVGAADRGSGSENVNVANCNQRQLVFALIRSAAIVRCLTAAVFEAAQLRMTSTGLNVSRSSLRPRLIFQARLHFAPM